MEDKVRSGVAEGRFTGAIESQTSKIPSSGYLAAAFGAITASAILKIVGKDDWALFVGQWPAAFLLMGVYNKMVKQHGSDAYSQGCLRVESDRVVASEYGGPSVRRISSNAFDAAERAVIYKENRVCRFWRGLCWV